MPAPRIVVLALAALSIGLASSVVACSEDEAAANAAGADASGDGGSPSDQEIDGAAVDDATTPDGGGSAPDGSVADATPDGASSDAGTAALIPTDGGAYFVAAIDGEPLSFVNGAMALRSPGGFSTARGNAGYSLPLRDMEIRLPSKIGSAVCGSTTGSLASIVYRTSDKGAFTTLEAETSCSFEVTAIAAAAGQRIKGTFQGTVKTDGGASVTITGGAFDLPTIN